MTRSSFRQPRPERPRPLMSKGYALGSGGPKPYEMVGPAPAGSLASPGADMPKFMIAHLNQGGPLMDPQTARLLHRPTHHPTQPLNPTPPAHYQQQTTGTILIRHRRQTPTH